MRAFHDIYNPTLAPMVIAGLVDEFPMIHLTMIGPDKNDGSFQRTIDIAKKLHVIDRISFCGRVEKKVVPRWMNQGDIFLNTSNIDNMPVSVIEAMACGLCVVSTDVGGLPYLLSDNNDALLVPPKDPRAMADAVRRVLKDPELARKLSFQGRLHAQQLDWSAVLPKWEMLLESQQGNLRSRPEVLRGI
jgi:glycosyltransferase involved in cell wall biosynthesis